MNSYPANVGAIHESPQRNRRSIRLQGYDYSQAGSYFVTICTQGRECLFGDIVDGEMRLNDTGRIVADEWIKTAEIRDEIELDEWVVMPNHFHGILVLIANVGAIHESPLHMTVSQRRNMAVPKIIGRFKMLSSKRINELRQSPGAKLWQRNYWEHIVRNETELNRIREYIHNNPAQWEMDKLHPSPMYGHDAPSPKEEAWMA
jgi:REP element-mobilizing transposase RayT